MSSTEVAAALPRKDLYRACYPAVEMRGEFGTETPPTLVGHFAVFNQPTEINSLREGNFMESIAPGAFAKSFRSEHSGNIKALFQHGRDPQIGDKPLGQITSLQEDDRGAYYEVEMFDTSYNRDLLPGLRAGVYGASFRFQVNREDVNKTPGESPANPRGIPERVVREAHVMEMGPVTFPAYAGATAGIRSITDQIHDVDALAYAGAIILDEERMNQARIFVSRDIPETNESDEDEAEGRGNYSADQRKQMAQKGHAMPDGSYPIGDAQDVKSAAGLASHSKKYSAEQVKAHVIKNARRLGAMSALPASWNVSSASAEDETSVIRDEALESAEQDAPPSDGAAASLPHPTGGRSETEHVSNPDAPLYGTRKEQPSWLLQ